MEVGFLPVDLGRWDQAEGGDVVAVAVFSDVRPLRGAAGLLDWRLNGKLSHWMREGRVQASVGEKVLIPTRRIQWRAVLAVGLGSSRAFSEEASQAALAVVLATTRALGLGDLAIALPGREINAITPERAFELLRTAIDLGGASHLTRLTVIDAAPTLKTIIGSMGPARRSQGAVPFEQEG